MEELISSRTPAVIAVEINTIRRQTTNFILVGSIEIGRRLKEAKEMLPHGEWGKWLKESVCYSQNTAAKLIRLYEGYGSKAPAVLNAETQVPEEIAGLNPTQAYLLLGVPEAERAQFIAELDVRHMSTRELEKAVQERNQAFREQDEALRRAYEEFELKDREIIAAYGKISTNRIAHLLDGLDKTLKELSFEMKTFAAKDPEGFQVYKKKLLTVLTRELTLEM